MAGVLFSGRETRKPFIAIHQDLVYGNFSFVRQKYTCRRSCLSFLILSFTDTTASYFPHAEGASPTARIQEFFLVVKESVILQISPSETWSREKGQFITRQLIVARVSAFPQDDGKRVRWFCTCSWEPYKRGILSQNTQIFYDRKYHSWLRHRGMETLFL